MIIDIGVHDGGSPGHNPNTGMYQKKQTLVSSAKIGIAPEAELVSESRVSYELVVPQLSGA